MAYLSGKTKDHAIVIDEDDERERRTAHMWRPPIWPPRLTGGVVDLTVSDDDVDIAEAQSADWSIARNNRKSIRRDIHVAQSGTSAQAINSSSLGRITPRTSSVNPFLSVVMDNEVSMIPEREGLPVWNSEEKRAKKEETTSEFPLRAGFSDASLLERPQTLDTSKTEASVLNPISTLPSQYNFPTAPLPSKPSVISSKLQGRKYPSPFLSKGPIEQGRLSSLQMTSSMRSPAMVDAARVQSAPPPPISPPNHPSVSSTSTYVPLASVTVHDVNFAGRNGVDVSQSPIGGVAAHGREQTTSSRVHNTSTTEFGIARSAQEERSLSISSGSINNIRSQAPSAAAPKQRAIKTANRPGEDRTSRPFPLPSPHIRAHEKDSFSLPSVRQVSPTKQGSNESIRSPQTQDKTNESNIKNAMAMSSVILETQRHSDIPTQFLPAVVSHGEQKASLSPFINSENQPVTPVATLSSNTTDQTSQKPNADAPTKNISESSGHKIVRLKYAQTGTPEDLNVHRDGQSACKDILLINADDYNTARSAVELCLKQQLVALHEAQAKLTESKMWRQRICYEAELRAQHHQRRVTTFPTLPEKYVQSTSPFKALPPAQTPFDKKSASEGVPDFSQEVYTPAKPKDTIIRSAWISPTTTYRPKTISIPAFKEYVGLKNSILADNESKLLATPYFQDEDDQLRQDLRILLPQFYEMKHDVNALSDLRSEQCRFYKDVVETFLRKICVSWDTLLFWLLAPDRVIKRIISSTTTGSPIEDMVLQRLPHQQESFMRDEETQKAILIDPDSERWRTFLSQLEEPNAKQLRVSALACAAVLNECGFSIWYLAQQSEIMTQHVARKTKEALASTKFTYRDVMCRVCHQHYCLFHGELRDTPDDSWEVKSNSSGTESEESEEVEDRDCFDERLPSRRNSQRPNRHDEENKSDDEEPIPAPAHWDDDSDVEKVISYKLPANPDAFNTRPETEMIESRGSKPPGGRFSRKWWYSKTYTHRWDRRKPFFPCNHAGSCEQAHCRCFREKIACEKTCRCSSTCARRFPGCTCASTSAKRVCVSTTCLCVKFNRECDADLCGACGATEILDPVNRYNEEILVGRCFNAAIQRGVPKKTLLGHSEVHGFGLYMGEDVKKDEFIGEYVGETVSVSEGARRYTIYNYQQTMYLFKLNTKQEVDATYMGNKLRFINNANKEYTNCAPRNLLCNTVFRLALYATTDVKAGTELFFYYSYPEETTVNFKQPAKGKGAVAAAEETVKSTAKRKTKNKPSASSPPIRSPDHIARVNAGLEKARAAKKKKRDAMLAEQTLQSKINNSSSGPQKARKTALNQNNVYRPSRVVQLSRRGIKTAQGPNSDAQSNISDSSVGPDDRYRLVQSGKSDKNHVIQDTDEEDDDFILDDNQKNGKDSNGSAFDCENTAAESSGGDTTRSNRDKTRMSMRATPIGEPKKMGGARAGAGQKRRIVFNSDDE